MKKILRSNLNIAILNIMSGKTYLSCLLYISEKPKVTTNCSSPIRLDIGADVSCTCRGKGGNPPANVTWYKEGKQIGGVGKEEQELILDPLHGADNGTYKCVVQSHTNATFKDEESIVVLVNC